ncbi:tyrosine-type recombinase/integrase [Amycolatopsis sp. NPDC101161]|uniref:tyrosine-type recombinase/integrase n=1 Tax=Amycolatopsis sp. NPDC101161 TaxID=3363940 RepID=UPI0038044D6F
MSRKANGEGSIYHRSDGRWAGSAFVDTVGGKRKRIHVYAATRREAHDRLEDKLATARRGIPTPDTEWSVGAYLDYWLTDVVATKNRPRTVELYSSTVRLYLKPALGKVRLSKLSVQTVQTLLNDHLAQGRSIRLVQLMRSVLRAALSRAQREELIPRNVAKLVELEAWKRKPIQPWNLDEAMRFLQAAEGHRWYLAYVMLLAYGMRRGEVLGLRWCDLDIERGIVHVTQQLQRVGSVLELGPVKTEAGQRDLPLLALLRDGFERLYRERQVEQGEDLVFLSSTGTPVDPKNFVRTFHEIRERAGLPRITVHHTRHTAATLLKNMGVPARDAQLILGHSHVTTTQQLYQHGDLSGQTKALERIEQLLTGGAAVKTAVNDEFSTGESTILRALTPGGPSETRTQDTLLKRKMLSEIQAISTPVTKHLRARSYAHVVGWVAVKICCNDDSRLFTVATQVRVWIDLLQLIREAETTALAQRCFPFALLPASVLRGNPSADPREHTN